MFDTEIGSNKKICDLLRENAAEIARLKEEIDQLNGFLNDGRESHLIFPFHTEASTREKA